MNEDRQTTDVLTMEEVAERLRCSKAHAAKLMNGQEEGSPARMAERLDGGAQEPMLRSLESGLVAIDAGKRKTCVESDFSEEA